MKLPSYNLPSVLALRRKLTDSLTLFAHSCSLTGADFEDLVSHLQSLLPEGLPRPALFESARHLAGLELTGERITELSWRLAGNVQRLRGGQAVPSWSRQLHPEWAPLQILDASPERFFAKARGERKKVSRDGNRFLDKVAVSGVRCRFLVLAGSPAGRRVERFWSDTYVRFIRQELGFSRFDRQRYTHVVAKAPNYPFRDHRELVQLRLYGYFDPELADPGVPFTEIRGTPSTRSWNRAVFQRRQREAFTCPRGYELRLVPCFRCEAGYDTCPAACRPRTLVPRHCPGCKKDSWFDDKVDQEVCVDCHPRRH